MPLISFALEYDWDKQSGSGIRKRMRVSSKSAMPRDPNNNAQVSYKHLRPAKSFRAQSEMADICEKSLQSLDEKNASNPSTPTNNGPYRSKETQVSYPAESSSRNASVEEVREGDVEAQVSDPDAISITPAAVKTPRSQRRGLLARFAILAEVEEPKHYSRRSKWFITFVVALAAVAAPIGSAIFFRMSSRGQRALRY